MSRKFTDDHEWIDLDGNIATIGITDFAAAQLGDVVFVEQPNIGDIFSKGDACAVVESTKAASDVYAPLSGTILEVNNEIVDNPALVNDSTEDKAWFFKIEMKNNDELNALMDAEAYKKHIG